MNCYRLKSLLTLATISLLCGCASQRPFILGLYDVPPDAFREVKEAGFDVIVSRPGPELMNAAHAENLKVLMHTSAFSRPLTDSNIDRALHPFDRHPAAWGWYLVDEPDLHDLPPNQITRSTRAFQQHASKPGVVVVASGVGAKTYGPEPDLLMIDFYPVPWSPVARFAKEVRLTALARDEKPFLAVVQAFDWSHFPAILGQTNGLRPPTIAEVRCMSYMALALEAKGLFYYSFQAGSWNLRETALWPELKDLAGELRRDAPLFATKPLWWPTQIEYGNRERMYNEVHESAILTRLYHLEKAAPGFAPGYYFLLINTTGEPIQFSFEIPFEDIEVIGRPGSNEIVPLENRWLRQTYDPFAVKIFGPIKQRPLFEN